MDPKLLARLEEPDCYPHSPSAIEIRQTHLSVVCLAGDFAYKLKKPIRFSFVDFSTPELREHFCREELRLNRRLCPDVYLDVVPLFRTADGSWSFRENAGEIEDHAVLMKRLPEELMMDRLLAQDDVSIEQTQEVARIVARFHQQTEPTAEALEAGSPANQLAAILDNFDVAKEVFDPGLHEAVEKRAVSDAKRSADPTLNAGGTRAGGRWPRRHAFSQYLPN